MDEIDEMVVAVRADTGAFRRDIAALRGELEGSLGNGADAAGRAIERALNRAIVSGKLGMLLVITQRLPGTAGNLCQHLLLPRQRFWRRCNQGVIGRQQHDLHPLRELLEFLHDGDEFLHHAVIKYQIANIAALFALFGIPLQCARVSQQAGQLAHQSLRVGRQILHVNQATLGLRIPHDGFAGRGMLLIDLPAQFPLQATLFVDQGNLFLPQRCDHRCLRLRRANDVTQAAGNGFGRNTVAQIFDGEQARKTFRIAPEFLQQFVAGHQHCRHLLGHEGAEGIALRGKQEGCQLDHRQRRLATGTLMGFTQTPGQQQLVGRLHVAHADIETGDVRTQQRLGLAIKMTRRKTFVDQ